MESKVDMSLDEIIKMGKKHRQSGGRPGAGARTGGGPRNRGGRNRNPGAMHGSQQGGVNQKNKKGAAAQSGQNPRGGRRRRRGRGGQNQNSNPQLASAVQRPHGTVGSSSGVRYNMKTGRVRRRGAQDRDAQRPARTGSTSQSQAVNRGSVSAPSGRRSRSRRNRPGRSGERPGPASGTGTIHDRADLVRRLVARARKREAQTNAREAQVMRRRGLVAASKGGKTAAQRQQPAVRAARKRVAAATRRSKFSAGLRRSAPQGANLKVSVAVRNAPATKRSSNQNQLIEKYRAEARKLIDAVKSSTAGGLAD